MRRGRGANLFAIRMVATVAASCTEAPQRPLRTARRPPCLDSYCDDPETEVAPLLKADRTETPLPGRDLAAPTTITLSPADPK